MSIRAGLAPVLLSCQMVGQDQAEEGWERQDETLRLRTV